MAVIDDILALWWALLPGGVIVLLWSANRLVEGAVALARLIGMSTLVIGLTIVAAGTSAPELAVNVIAAAGGNTALSFGNVIGSNIANIGLVVGLGAIVAPLAVHSQVIRRELPWLIALSIWCFITPLFLPPGKLDGANGFNRLDGVILLVLFIIFLWVWYRIGRRHGEDPLTREAHEKVMEVRAGSPVSAAALVLVGMGGLFIGGFLTREGAIGCATKFGMSEALVGLTVVAVATSLPEVFTTLAAVRKNQADLAVGNVVGSNVFNLLFVLGTTSIMKGVAVPEYGVQDLVMMLVFTGLLYAFCRIRSETKRVNRIEGACLLVLWAGYLAWGVLREHGF